MTTLLINNLQDLFKQNFIPTYLEVAIKQTISAHN